MTQLTQNSDQIKNNYCVIDLETTGLDYRNDAIIELAVIKFGLEGISDTYQSFVNPGRKIPSFISDLTGISDKDVLTAPEFSTLIPKLKNFIGDSVLIGHNVGFDVGFLREFGFNFEGTIFDTLDLSYVIHPTQLDYSLTGLSLFLDLDISNAHRAMADCENTMNLFINLITAIKSLKLQTFVQINNMATKGSWESLPVLQSWLSERLLSEKTNKNILSLEADPSTESQIEVQTKEIVFSADLQDVFSDHGALAYSLTAFEERQEQLDMAVMVKETIENNSTSVIEAGTGVGKSMAYLIPAIQYAKDNDKRVVISTNTINLQDQLMEEDLPIAAWVVRAAQKSYANSDVKYSVLKGRRNYLCLKKFRYFASREQLEKTETILISKILVWLDTTLTGDQAELNLSRTQHRFLWSRLNAEGAFMCGGYNGKCFLKQAREEASTSDLVVVNHSLLMADLKSARSLLPEFGALVIDEAHHLEDQATQAFGFQVSHGLAGETLSSLRGRDSIFSNINTLFSPLKMNAEDVRGLSNTSESVALSLKNLQDSFNILFSSATGIMNQSTTEKSSFSSSDKYRIKIGEEPPLWEDLCSQGRDIEEQVSSISRGLIAANRILEKYENHRSVVEILGDIQNTQNSIIEVNNFIQHFLFERTENYVYWISLDHNPEYSTLSGAPIEVGDQLKDQLFEQKFSVVITSATLSTDGSFQHINQRLGINPEYQLLLGSPFPYEDLATVVMPTDIPDPREPYYEEMVAKNIYQAAMAAGGRTIALFTSHSSLKAVFQLLKDKYPADYLDILAQGISGTPRQLIERMKKHPETVLLGTSSFWEGIDLRGDALQVLVITRLPFDVPSDPIYAARAEKYSNPFMEYALPNAIIRFRQGFGRLVRSNKDRGAVFILDSRVTNSRYGHRFIKALPRMEIQRPKSEEVESIVSGWLGL